MALMNRKVYISLSKVLSKRVLYHKVVKGTFC